MIIGNAAIYLFGVLWLGALIGVKQAIAVGVVPFLIGDGLKIISAALLLPTGWKIIEATHSFDA